MKSFIINNGTKEIFQSESDFKTCFSHVLTEMGCYTDINEYNLTWFCEEFENLLSMFMFEELYIFETYSKYMTDYQTFLKRSENVITSDKNKFKLKIALGISMLLWAYYALTEEERANNVIFCIPNTDVSLLLSAKVLINSSFKIKYVFGNEIVTNEFLSNGKLILDKNSPYQDDISDYFDIVDKSENGEKITYQIGNFDRVKFNNYVITPPTDKEQTMDILLNFYDKYEYLTDLTAGEVMSKLENYRKINDDYNNSAILFITRTPYVDAEILYTELTGESVKDHKDAVKKLYDYTAIPAVELMKDND